MGPIRTLTQDQIDFYNDNGLLAIDSVATPDEIDRLCGIFDHLFASQAGRADGGQFDLSGVEGKAPKPPQILSPRRYAPELNGTLYGPNGMLYEPNAAVISRQLLGEDAKFEFDHAILKPAGSGAPTPWY